MTKKVLIANRGEIAVRIIKAAQQLGIKTLVVLSELEKDTISAQISDEVHLFTEGALSETYLNIPLIIDIAKRYDADSIHPGYGFISESHHLAKACHENGILFIGPSANHLKLMGDKQMARTISEKVKVPLTKSWEGELQALLSQIDSMHFPVLVKAVMGGGGKGMHICNSKEELIEQLPIISQQAKRYFGDIRLYIEQYIPNARHIEVQVLADNHGNIIHLHERECSVQRRYQKIIEEAPAENIDYKIKQKLFADALKISKYINYSNVGTVEFLLDNNGQYFFLEMNTRIQVEHCVTEEITGIDLVQWQFKIANGEKLHWQQNNIEVNGHAIELRICAEDPQNNFQPSPGTIKTLILPKNNDARIEIGLQNGQTIHSQFDTMIAKLITHAPTRGKAIKKAIEINKEFLIRGIKTNAQYIDNILKTKDFLCGQIHTNYCEQQINSLVTPRAFSIDRIALAYAAFRFNKLNNKYWRQLSQFCFTINKQKFKASHLPFKNNHLLLNDEEYFVENFEINHQSITYKLGNEKLQFYLFEDSKEFEVIHQLQSYIINADDRLPEYTPKNNDEPIKDKHLIAPIPSNVMKVCINEGQKVSKGDLLLVLEAMKTENYIKAWKDGIIERVYIKDGQQVKLNQPLLNYLD